MSVGVVILYNIKQYSNIDGQTDLYITRFSLKTKWRLSGKRVSGHNHVHLNLFNHSDV